MDSIIELARTLGPYAICGEGNVSVKDDDCFWVKASGTSLDTLGKKDLVACKMSGVPFDEHRLFPDQVVRNGAKSCVVPYAMPGKPLLEEIKKSVLAFIEVEEYFPKLILLQNHGIIVASTSHKECIASTLMCEKSAEIFIGAKVLGQTRFLSADEVEEIDKCPSEERRRMMYR